MEHSVRDVIEQLRPRLKFPTTLEECLVAVEKIEREAAEKLEQMGLNNGGLGMFRVFRDEILKRFSNGEILEFFWIRSAKNSNKNSRKLNRILSHL